MQNGKNVKMLYKESIDASSGVLMPFYDPDTSVVYLAGKVRSIILIVVQILTASDDVSV